MTNPQYPPERLARTPLARTRKAIKQAAKHLYIPSQKFRPWMRDLWVLSGYCGLIFWLSNHSTLPMPESDIPFEDKWIHGTAYAIMGLLAWRAFRHRFTGHTLLIIAACFCSLYGISDEWHQSFVPGRDADPFDWLADAIGGLIGASYAARYRLKWRVFS